MFAGAWAGLVLVLGHAAVHGFVKYRLNEWYASFYDVLGSASALVGNATTTADDWAAKRAEVAGGLVDFAKIAAIAVGVMPVAKLVRSMWTLHWRLALTRSYLRAWDANRPAIEGSAQRVQEDAQRFARGTELCVSVGLDALITLVIFVPVLLRLGADTRCPDVVEGYRGLGSGWLVGLAIFTALVGFGITLAIGHRLVNLEVQNQVVEARLRTDLVLLETSPDRVCVTVHHPPDPDGEVDVNDLHGPTHTLMPPLPRFMPTIANVRHNYTALFLNFSALNLWLAVFEQFATILPYLVFAPLLFSSDAASRVTMGTVIQVSNAFDKVFSSLNVVADNWVGINEYRSVLVRLRQFEANLYRGVPHPARVRPRSATRFAPFEGVAAEVSMTEPDAGGRHNA